MVKPFSLIAVVAFATTLTSCFKDEALNNECDIEKAWIQVDNPDEVFGAKFGKKSDRAKKKPENLSSRTKKRK